MIAPVDLAQLVHPEQRFQGDLQFLMATAVLREASEQCDQSDYLAQRGPQMAQDHAATTEGLWLQFIKGCMKNL